MTDKKIGYILLAAGIIMMIYAATQIIQVFTGKAKPIEIVTYSSDSPSESSTMNDLFKQFEGGQLPSMQLFDPKALNDIINLTVYYVIMQFLLSMGYKLSSLGVQLIRPIVVQVKNKKLESISEDDTEKTINK